MRALSVRALCLAAAVTAAAPAAPAAELELSVYSGVQEADRGRVRGNDPVLGAFSFGVDWAGKSSAMPPYYGLRATWWQPGGWGWGVEVNHAKVYADSAAMAANGFTRLEFTDGLNLVTAHALRRWDLGLPLRPYAGAGIGAAIPHVDVTTPGGKTLGYQVTGPAVVWMAGASLPVSDRWSVFAEYKGSRSWNTADLTGGGKLKADVTTHALNLGVSFRY
ncbi:MAG: outer membrane beta-barrel protein [Rhodobacterales bacterium]|nr:outer membrane beta-barrel protein [Rhodobacterales bacterium]